jgi:hypothetical protein
MKLGAVSVLVGLLFYMNLVWRSNLLNYLKICEVQEV